MLVADYQAEEGHSPLAAPSRPIVISLFAGIVSTAVIYDALPPVLPAISANFGGGTRGDLIAQLAMTLPLLGMALSGLFSGRSIDRFGIKPVLIAALLAFAIFGSVGMFIHTALPLLAARIATGIAAGTMLTCGTTLIAAHYTGLGRLRMAGRLFAVGAICSVTFIQISGIVATISWRAPFLLHLVFALIFATPILLMKLAPSAFGERHTKESGFDVARQIMPAAPAYCYIFLLNFVSYLFSVQLVFLLASIGVHSSTSIANVVMVYAFGALAGNLAVTRIEARLGTVATIAVGCALLSLAAYVCAVSWSLEILISGPFIGGIGTGLAIPSNMTLIMRSVPLALSARALSIGTSMMYLGGGSAPLVIAPLGEAVGVRGVYYTAVFVIGLAAMPLVALSWKRAQPETT